MAANKTFWWDAPKGFKAVACRKFDDDNFELCFGCFMFETNIPCPCPCTCIGEDRKDKQTVIFIKRENHVQ